MTAIALVPRQMPLPEDAYDSHDYTPNDFGECIGCGLDRWARCHPLPPVEATVAV